MNREEQIAAYIDGSMSAAERAAFEAEMAGDQEMANAVERWRENDALLRAAYAPAADGVDAALLQRLGLADADQMPAAANDNPPIWRRWLPVGGALAASLALAYAAFAPSGETAGSFAGQVEFQTALETAPSGSRLVLADGRQFKPVLTFKAGDGRYCREFAVGGSHGGIACRGKGSWIVEAYAKGAADLPDASEIRTAAGADTKVLDQTYTRLKGSDPVSMETEKQMISKNWR
jgi:hypothetical protein